MRLSIARTVLNLVLAVSIAIGPFGVRLAAAHVEPTLIDQAMVFDPMADMQNIPALMEDCDKNNNSDGIKFYISSTTLRMLVKKIKVHIGTIPNY